MEELKTPSPRWQLNRHDIDKIAKSFFYATLSAMIGVIYFLSQNIEIPVEWAFVLPLINTGLVTIKKLSDGKVAQLTEKDVEDSSQTECQ